MLDNQPSPSKELEEQKGGDLSDKLLPCPFCGENPEIEYGSARDFIQCCNNMCPAHSPITYVKFEDDRKKAYKKWNTRTPSKNEDPEGLVYSYVASRKLANKMNVSVTLHYEGLDYTIKPMRLGEKVNKLREQLTTTQQALDTAVEALKGCLGDYKIAYDAMMSKHLMQPTYMHQMSRNISLEQAGLKINIIQAALERAALASIGKAGE